MILFLLNKKLFIKTFGCQMNQYDSDKINDVLDNQISHEKTDNPAKADLIILNTCSIREKAQEKVFSDLGRWQKLKQKNPQLVIAVGGCVASQEGSCPPTLDSFACKKKTRSINGQNEGRGVATSQ